MSGEPGPGIPPARRAVLSAIKARGAATVSELAADIGITGAAVRQHLAALESGEQVASSIDRRPGRDGRPAQRFRLTAAGERFFPRHEDALVDLLFAAIGDAFGDRAPRRVLEAATDRRVAALAPRLAGLDLAGRVTALRALYLDGDPWVDVEEVSDGWLLTERNCPFLDTAMRRPALCSTSVCTLERLLGVRVLRTRRFQDGDGCCTFHILRDEPADGRFHLEDDADGP